MKPQKRSTRTTALAIFVIVNEHEMFSDKFTPLVKWRTGKTTSHLFGLIINMLELVEFNKRTCFLTQVKLKSFDVICNRFLFHFDLLSCLPTPQILFHLCFASSIKNVLQLRT